MLEPKSMQTKKVKPIPTIKDRIKAVFNTYGMDIMHGLLWSSVIMESMMLGYHVYMLTVVSGAGFMHMSILIIALITLFKDTAIVPIMYGSLFLFLAVVMSYRNADSNVKFMDRTSERSLSNITFIDNSKLITYKDELSGEMLSENLNEADYYKLKAHFLEGKNNCVNYAELYRTEAQDYNKTISGFECK